YRAWVEGILGGDGVVILDDVYLDASAHLEDIPRDPEPVRGILRGSLRRLRFLGCRRGWSVLARCAARGVEGADCTQKNRGQDNPSQHAAKRPSLCRFVWSIHDE